MAEVTLICGDATERWPLPDNSFDSIVTDPPYGIAFMGKKWDDMGGPQAYQEWTVKWASEALRCLKPGGFLLAFGSPRMAHRMACGFEDAGFRIVDTIEWLYLTGFPKAQSIGKMLNKWAGAKREVVKKWDGWKTPSLKPAHEPIIMAQKPFSGTYIDNIERWGVGAINVDGCRIPYREGTHPIEMYGKSWAKSGRGKTITWNGDEYVTEMTAGERIDARGRFPANVVTLDEDEWYSRYFNITPRKLSKKASPAERKGDGWQNNHPTVKPVELVRWLQRLVTPPGGTTASPFLGSGTDAVAAILEGFNFWGMELSDEYWPIIEARFAWAKEQEPQAPMVTEVQPDEDDDAQF